jgi:SAGA-associated factor 73
MMVCSPISETLQIPTYDIAKTGKKRKAEDEVEDPSNSKKSKKGVTPKITKGRLKGPVDLDKQCGVINDKNLPCSRSLTCKSHSMGAKRAVTGRSQRYDDLLLAWNREHNPKFVEPVKRETKAEKKEKKDKEKAEKKRLAAEAASAAGEAAAAAGAGTKKAEGATKSKKKKTGGGTQAASQAAATTITQPKNEDDEDWDALDSDEEYDTLVRSVHTAQARGIVAQPLAVPNDISPWFVVRRERLRNCHHQLSMALNSTFPASASLGRPGFMSSTGRIP